MGWFGSSTSSTTNTKDPQEMAQIEQQIEMMDIVFQRSIKGCGKKCIPTTYREGDLNKGESVCIQRCVAKYFETLEVVSQELAEIGGTTKLV